MSKLRQRKSNFVLMGVAALFSAFPAFAKRDCDTGDVTIVVPFPMRQLNSPTNPSVDFTIRRRNPSVECNYWVGFSRGQAATYDRRLFSGSEQLDYEVFKTQSSSPLNLKSYPDAVSLGEVYTGRFDRGGTNPNQQTFTTRPQMIPPLPGPFNLKRPGNYSDTLQIRVFEGTFPPSGAPLEVANAMQSYSYNVPPLSIVSLLDTGAPYTEPPMTLKTINFGTLTSGKLMSFDMVLLYNSGYRVKLTSQHGSRMKHDTRSTYVPYTMALNGVPATLNAGQPVQVLSGAGVSPSAPTGLRVPVSVTVGTVAGSFAGTYGDSITIEVTSL